MGEKSGRPSTLVELLRHRAQIQPEKLAYTFLLDGELEEARLTSGELDQRARAIGAQLQRKYSAGDRALMVYPSGLEFIEAFFGCLYAGLIAVPAYPPDPFRLERTLPRFRALAQDAQPVTALSTKTIVAMATALLQEDPLFQSIDWLATDGVPNDHAEDWRDPDVNRDTLAFLQYTSGSTAVPKGVMVSHGNILYNEAMIKTAFQHTEESTFVGWLPLYHDMGLIGNVLQPMYINAHGVLMSPLHFLQRPFRWLKAITRFQARTSGAPNFAFDLCVRKISPEQKAQLNLESWEVAYNGAEPVRHQTLVNFGGAFEVCGFRPEALYPCYGLAEATLFVSGGVKSTPPIVGNYQSPLNEEQPDSGSSSIERTLVSCGRTWQDQKIVIVDPDSLTRCTPQEEGEIWVSGPNVAQGYWNRPEETALTFQAYLADSGEGPFLRTGDLGYMHDGNLFISGRLKDLIIIDGMNHYPQDIELVVEQCHPALRPGCSAAFSVEAESGERLIVVAEVVTDSKLSALKENGGVDLDPESITNCVRKAISRNHDIPVHGVMLLNARSIPKTSSGKIQRHLCKQGYLANDLERWEG